MQEKTIVLFVSDCYLCFQKLESHHWNYKSLLRNIVRMLSTENTLPLSCLYIAFVSFLTLGDWTPFPQHRSGLWNSDFSSSDQYEVSLQFSKVDSSVSHCLEQLPDHTMTSQSKIVRNSVFLTCTILPGSGLKAFHSLIIVHDPILHRNLGYRHPAKSYWPSLRVLVQFHALRLHGFSRRSCTQFVLIVRIGRNFELVALRHLLSFGRLTACCKKIMLPCNRSRCNKFVNWIRNTFFDPQHSDLRFGCWHTDFSSEIKLIPWSQEFFQDSVP